MKVLLTFGLLAALAQYAGADILVQPTSAVATSAQRAAVGSINGSGLSDGTVVETGDAIPATYPSHNRTAGDMWGTWSGAAVGASITYSLGAAYDLNGMHLWNYNEIWTGDSYDETQRGIQVATVEYSADNGSNWSSLGDMTFTQAPGSTSYTGEDYTFGSTLADVTDVRFTVVSTFNDATIAGLSEVRFVAIPEPATMGLIGVFGIGTLFVRRRLMM